MKILFAGLIILSLFACTKHSPSSSSPAPGWTDAQLNEVSEWHFKNVSSHAQTMANHGDNAKREFSRCWAEHMSHEYSYSEYKRAYDEYDAYVIKNHVVITTIDQAEEVGHKYPFFAHMNEFVVACTNELKI